MNCQFCEDYEWSKKHRPKTGRELYTKYYVCLYERTLRKGCGLTSTYTHKRRPLNFCPECGRQLKKTKKEDETRMESFGADARGVAGKLFIRNFTRTHGTTQSEKTEKFRNAMYPEAEN